MNYPQDNVLVQTNMGAAYRHKGAWYIWDLHNGRGSRHKYPDQKLFKHWEPLVEESWMMLPTQDHFAVRERISECGMLGIDERMKLPKKVGWFRPIYYYLPILGSVIAVALCLFLAKSIQSTFYQWAALLWLPVIRLQWRTAKRQYDDWMFNWQMLQVAEEFKAAVAYASQVDWYESWSPEWQLEEPPITLTTGASA
jgi:hypothetical protein